MDALHVTRVPPALPVPLHWLIRTAMAVLTEPPAVQLTVEPPPLADPLHCVIVAPLVPAG
jgi:hypothetical protein